MSQDQIQKPLLKQENRASVFFDKTPIQISYNIKITAKIKNQGQKIILHPQSGVIPAQSFTAILGPSGSGKTTFLNFMAGRLMSQNLKLEGSYKLNGINVSSVQAYSNQIGYVMQQDSLLATLSPYQCFKFAADMKLSLKFCKDVKIGNNFIKGVSGGQRKRTSIGIQLITNPNIIFLDQPTTGLDSTTALQVIQMLSSISKKGKTIISTIHQPSSQLFAQFDRLMLLVEGRCIYSNSAQQSYGYFQKIGYKCPQLMNASQFYLDLMSLQTDQDDNQQIYQQKRAIFQNKIIQMQQNFKKSQYAIKNQNQSLLPVEKQTYRNISIFLQLWLIFYRSLICQIRNPMDMTLKIVQSVFTSLIVFIVFGRIDKTDQSYQQNLRGVCFFLVSYNAFSGIQGTLATFAVQRSVFIRQRYSKTYSSFTYFIGRTLCSFPFDLIYPTLAVSMVYWMTGLGNSQFQQFIKIVLIVNVTYFLCASYGLFYSTIIPKLQVAMAIVPILVIPFMLLGGFFINLDGVTDIRVIFFPLIYLSPFKYGYQAIMQVIKYDQKADFKPIQWDQNLYIMLGIGIGIRIISMIAMKIVSTPKRPKLQKIDL